MKHSSVLRVTSPNIFTSELSITVNQGIGELLVEPLGCTGGALGFV